VDIRQLKYLVAVAEEGGFTRVAERLQVAQPSLSQQIKKLERELHQSLFDRLPRGTVLTEDGPAEVGRGARSRLPSRS
jgi:DNA-binding transcriptional LysR family regulator